MQEMRNLLLLSVNGSINSPQISALLQSMDQGSNSRSPLSALIPAPVPFPPASVVHADDPKVVWLTPEGDEENKFAQMASGTSSALAFPASIRQPPAIKPDQRAETLQTSAGQLETARFGPVASLRPFSWGVESYSGISATHPGFSFQPDDLDPILIDSGPSWLTDASASELLQSWQRQQQQQQQVVDGNNQSTLASDLLMSYNQPYRMENLDYLFGWDAPNINPSRADPANLLNLLDRPPL